MIQLNEALGSNGETHKSLAGYEFNALDALWQLDKNTKIRVGAVTEIIQSGLNVGYRSTLTHYAVHYSAGYVHSINEKFLRLLRKTKSTLINEVVLINYRASLDSDNEHYLGTLKAFFVKWYQLGHIGISEAVVDLLNTWTLKGTVKGDVVKRLDSMKGPLSDIELQAFNEKTVQAFEKNLITISDLALALLTSNTGRRPVQITHLKIKDVLEGKNHKGEPLYLLNIPRGKQRQAKFRSQFKQFAITHELWVILSAQIKYVQKEVRDLIDIEIKDSNLLELPLFPDVKAIAAIQTQTQLEGLLNSDRLHIKSNEVTNSLRSTVDAAQVYSERTGELLNISAYRFRYTTGTRAAREGFGVMVIAELLDHSDNQNAGIYIENVPDHAAKLDEAMGYQLAPYAQAFAGFLVDSEKEAKRGNELSSRIKNGGSNIGTCGSYGFCGGNVPIPCYTCNHFQPWLDGPHEKVLEDLIRERQRLLDVTHDSQIAAVNDRTILAVGKVIQLCKKRKEELANG